MRSAGTGCSPTTSTDRPSRSYSSDVNDYLHDVGGPTVTARDFRTWGGTVSVVEVLGPTSAARGKGEPPDPSDLPSFLDAVDVAAERLGNTRAVCRSSYVHPVVEPALHDGRLATSWARSRRSARMTRAERATLRLLAAD